MKNSYCFSEFEKKTLKDIFTFSSGKSIKPILKNGKYPVFGSNGIIGFTDRFNEENALLIGRVGASGSIHNLSQKGWITDNVLIAKINGSIDKKYLYYSLIQLDLQKYATKSAQPLLTQQILNPVQINIPSTLKEQQKIASILSNVDELIQKTEQIIEQTQRLKKGLMQKLLTKGIGHTKFKTTEFGYIPYNWKIIKIKDVSSVSCGTTPSTLIRDYYIGDIPFIRTNEIINAPILNSSLFINKKAMEDYGLKLYPEKSVFLAMYGQGKTRGQVGILKISATTSQNTAAITTDEKILNPYYLYYFLMHNYNNLRNAAMHGYISHLNLSIVKNFEMLLPTITEQSKIVEIIDNIENKIIKDNQIKQFYTRLKKGLMQQLLTGKIRGKV